MPMGGPRWSPVLSNTLYPSEFLLQIHYPTLSQVWTPVKALENRNTDQTHLQCAVMLHWKSMCNKLVTATRSWTEHPWDLSWRTSHWVLPLRPSLWGPFPPSECSGVLPWERVRAAPPEALFPGSTLYQQSVSSKNFRGQVFHLELSRQGEFPLRFCHPFPSAFHKV